jgi:multidrug resistance efflux pump
MSAWRALRWCFLSSLAALRALLSGARRVLLSARAVVLFLLLLIGVIVAYYVLSDHYTPFTTDAYVQAYVVQVAPRVEGQVVHVYVQENQSVKKGELLFEIDPRPFQYRVELLEAKRKEAVQQVAQLKSELAAAKHEDDRLVAEEAYAKTVRDQETEIYKGEATTNRRYVEAVQKYKAAQSALERSRAQVRKAEQALEAEIKGEHALVAQVDAQLAEARLNLEWTRVYAPANGHVTNVQLREGSYVHVGTPVLTFVDGEQWWVVANYRENSLPNVRPGQRVGVAFSSDPGRIFPGVVESVGWGVEQGQGTPSGNLPAVKEPPNWIRLSQRFQVRVRPELPPEYPLRVGATANVVVYTHEGYWLNDVTDDWQKVVAYFDYLR